MILSIISLILCSLALLAEFSRTLMLVQQNSYRIDRFRRSLTAMGDSSSFPKLFGIIVVLGSALRFVPDNAVLVVFSIFALAMLILRLRERRTYKHPLVWTPRVRRIYGVMLALVVILLGLVSLLPTDGAYGFGRFYGFFILLAWVKADWVAIAALWLLKPVEKHINQGYINDAKRILESMPDLKVIGITGSYGKTSTKHYLNRILSERFAVCMTPGSFNTTLGVVRTVREYLKPYDRIFICEMGAKQTGDIKEICDLVHPKIGIITAVGPQHLESFKTIENVQATKFELIDSLPADGLAVLNNDFEYVANREVKNVAALRYGVSADGVEYTARNIRYSHSGTEFTIAGPQGELQLHTRLVGECNVSNLMAAVIVALRLGMTPGEIARGVEQIEQVEHRLSVKRTPAGITILDDAFNSNPAGSAMALDVLRSMGGCRFVITPGMIELGDRQEDLNREFGRKIAEASDVAIVVGRYNREAIVSGIESANNPKLELHVVDTFAEAQALMISKARPGDAVLYENDLPDTFK